MTRYEPHCDCLGGHVSMIPDPNGRWCRGDDPRAVADDPSGIVQQMPEGDLAELRSSIPAGPWIKLHGMANATVCPSDQYDAFMRGDLVQGSLRIVHDGDPRDQVCVDIASAIAMLPDLLDEVIARRSTEADLRAENERLRANAKGMRALLRAGCDLLADEYDNLKDSITMPGGGFSTNPLDAWAVEKVAEMDDWIASVKATLFPPALSPETDGGQDG